MLGEGGGSQVPRQGQGKATTMGGKRGQRLVPPTQSLSPMDFGLPCHSCHARWAS